VGRLTPLRRFVRTETGGAAVLVAAVLAALVWANVGSSYQEVWETPVALTFGDDGIRLSLREWVNSGLMTFFFLVTGLEARRELDLGELRERRRLVLPLLAAVGGMAASVAIYLAFNLGGPSPPAGGSRCPATQPWGWASSRSRRRARLSACAPSSSPCSSSTSSSRWS
jgi:Na+/H+ antiporter NhaA